MTLEADNSQAAVDLKTEWDATSSYQVKNLVNHSSVENIEKDDMIDHLHFDLNILTEKLSFFKKSLYDLKKENTCISSTNDFLHT